MLLKDIVLSVINDFVAKSELFTALDVSNAVKNTMPGVRHRDVRDAVRAVYNSDIEPSGYGRTPIQVTLTDGSTVEALLYHPLVDSWDLDAKYDAQKRAQVAVHPAAPVPSSPVSATIANDGTIQLTPPSAVLNPAPVTAPTIAPPPATSITARAKWDQLFQSSPSLFPRRN